MGKSKGKGKIKAKALQTTPIKKKINDAEVALPIVNTPTIPVTKVVSTRPKLVVETEVAVLEPPKVVAEPKKEAVVTHKGVVLEHRYENGAAVFTKILTSEGTLLQYHKGVPNSQIFEIGTQVSYDPYTFRGKTACGNVKAIGESKQIKKLAETLNSATKLKKVFFGDLADLAVNKNKDVSQFKIAGTDQLGNIYIYE